MFLEPRVAGGGARAGVPGVRGSGGAADARQPLRPRSHTLRLGAQRPQGSRQLHHHLRW